MCGIVGIYSKSERTSLKLGALTAAMLVQLADRGPDSAGMAIYREPVGAGHAKISVRSEEPDLDWDAAASAVEAGIGLDSIATVGDRSALLRVAADPEAAAEWIAANLPDLQILGAGSTIEVYKDAVAPTRFVERYGIESMSGTHALAHTRMATESRVTPAGSHPFSTGRDLCLVHNGSLSNHNWLRGELQREGTVFRTDNDSEVAAGYLTWRLGRGDSLETALAGCLEDLDGFYTFAVATPDGFAVLRDPIACKPAVMAETDSWVAMASEYRALADLPGAADAEVWEPEPGVVYSWGMVAA